MNHKKALMKKTRLWHCLPVMLLLAGCGNKPLSKLEAMQVLASKYPRTIDVLIYAGDPQYVGKLWEAGLDTGGYIVIKRTKPLGDTTGWATFTEKSTPYLLETTAEDRKHHIQKVKAGEEQLADIVSVDEDKEGKMATVTYTTKSAATPFGKLIQLQNGASKQRTVQLIKNGNTWQLKGKGME